MFVDFEIQGLTSQHVRNVLTFLSIAGDFNGIFSIILFIGGLILYPITNHLFIHEGISELYLVNTKDDFLFNEH